MICKPQWTTAETAILIDKYQFGIAATQASLTAAGYARSPGSIKTRACAIGLRINADVISEMRRVAASASMREKGGRDAVFVKKDESPAGLPDEYIKVSSIWRVGARYAAQIAEAA